MSAALQPVRDSKVSVQKLSVRYGTKVALAPTDLEIPAGRVTALIGPSGCGKSTFLRCINRMNDLVENARVTGRVVLDGVDIYSPESDPVQVRRRVGMVFQRPNPFPKTIFENVAYGLRVSGAIDAVQLERRVVSALKAAAIWDEVKDRLHDSAFGLSGGQLQRICIARALAVEPDVLLMDEPASALDPIATAKIEELIHQLRGRYTVVIVTHNMQQAARVSDLTAFFYMGELIEVGATDQIFTRPVHTRTEDYVTGKFG